MQGMVFSPAARFHVKRIRIHYHYVRDHVARKHFVMRHVDTSKKGVDDLTKPLLRAAHTKCVPLMGLYCIIVVSFIAFTPGAVETHARFMLSRVFCLTCLYATKYFVSRNSSSIFFRCFNLRLTKIINAFRSVLLELRIGFRELLIGLIFNSLERL